MSSVIYIAEIAALLAVAYVIGWAIGYLAHRIVAHPAAVAAPAIPADRLAAAAGTAPDSLVKAPIIAPAPEPTPAAEPVVAETPVVAEAPVELPQAPEPELAPVEPSSPPLSTITIPSVAAPPPLFPEPKPPEPAVAEAPALILPEPAQPEAVAPAPAMAPEPIIAPEPVAAFTATPALKPGEAWTGEIKGRAAATFESTVDALTIEPEPEPQPEPEPATPAPIIEPTPVIEPVAIEPASIVVPEPQPTPAPVPEPTPEPIAPPREYDEDEAMRAIEGGWSRVKARAMPNAPELHDLGAAVAAAQTAVEQVLASAGIDPAAKFHTGKPKGLIRARTNGRDDLKRINGLGALDESTLNNLGFFHFDQIANWDDAEVVWMEAHVFARGRIVRENWQAQARELALTTSG